MEIEKTRETTWKIHLKKKSDIIEITSVEVSGLVKSIKLALKTNNDDIMVEMNKNEFFNFLSLILAFKDVIIGDEVNFVQDQSLKSEEYNEKYEDKNLETEDFNETFNKSIENEESDELNPEEWDPW
jgi:hypothetical protein